MRAHARVETNIARIKDQGGNRFPFAKFDPNGLWLQLAALADTLVRWFQKLSLPAEHRLSRAKPKHCAGTYGTYPAQSPATDAKPPSEYQPPGPPPPSSPPPHKRILTI